MTKVQLSLTPEEANILSLYGAQFGYSLPKTIKFMISKATESIVTVGSVPTFPLSAQREQKGLEALAAYEKGKTKEVTDFSSFFDSL